ncbi:MAG: ABC transporter permease [Spirochaetaceae bacterium]|jgi:ABC-2 type transport system permease protein|nr:ABC transporter permease [Spirochaetaceae bacterium]
MTAILNADFYKLKSNVALKVLPLAAVIWSVLTACFMLFVESGATVQGEFFSNKDIFGFNPTGALGVRALATLSNLYSILAVVFAGLFISTEFTQGTIRNAICVGVSRMQIYLSKLTVCAAMLALCMFLSTAAFIITFTIMYGFGNSAGFLQETITVFLMQFLYHFTYTGISCLLAFLIPNIVITVAAGIIVVIFSGLLVEICTAFDVLNGIAPFIPQYYVNHLNDELHNPLFLAMSVVATITFVVVTVIVGCSLFRRQDIK